MSTLSISLYQRRRIINALAITLACAAALFGLLFLGWILWTLLAKGITHFNLALLTQDQPPPMEAGGLRNAIIGSVLMCGMGVLRKEVRVARRDDRIAGDQSRGAVIRVEAVPLPRVVAEHDIWP